MGTTDHGNPRNVGQQPAIHPPISVGSDFFWARRGQWEQGFSQLPSSGRFRTPLDTIRQKTRMTFDQSRSSKAAIDKPRLPCCDPYFSAHRSFRFSLAPPMSLSKFEFVAPVSSYGPLPLLTDDLRQNRRKTLSLLGVYGFTGQTTHDTLCTLSVLSRPRTHPKPSEPIRKWKFFS